MATPQELKDQIAALRAEMDKPNEAGPLGAERLEQVKIKIQELAKRYAVLTLNIKEAARNNAILAQQQMKANLSGAGALGIGLAAKVGGTAIASSALGAPVEFERFTLAMRDLSGVIGQILAPVVERLTGVIRALADTIINLDPVLKEWIGNVSGITIALGGVLFIGSRFIALISGIGVAIKAVFAAGGPLTLALLALGAAATVAFSQIEETSDTWLKRFRNNLVKYFTLGAIDPGKPGAKSSMGAGGREVRFLSGQDIQRRGIEAALKVGGKDSVPEQQKKLAEDQLKELQKQNAILESIEKNIGGDFSRQKERLQDAIREVTRRMMQGET